MTRARGQPTRTLLNRDFPYQVLVRAKSVGGKMLDNIDAFHTSRMKRAARRADVWWSLYCFAQRANAQAFRDVFGGELFDLLPPH
jgi:hypothetical protein